MNCESSQILNLNFTFPHYSPNFHIWRVKVGVWWNSYILRILIKSFSYRGRASWDLNICGRILLDIVVFIGNILKCESHMMENSIDCVTYLIAAAVQVKFITCYCDFSVCSCWLDQWSDTWKVIHLQH